MGGCALLKVVLVGALLWISAIHAGELMVSVVKSIHYIYNRLYDSVSQSSPTLCKPSVKQWGAISNKLRQAECTLPSWHETWKSK